MQGMGWPLKARRVVISPEFLEGLFVQGCEFDPFVVQNGLEEGAKLVSIHMDAQTRNVVAVFTHPDWKPVYSLEECPMAAVALMTLPALAAMPD